MSNFKHHSIIQYSHCLASRDPVPGGGSAAALVAAMGVSLISMVARYSLGRSKTASVEKKIRKILKESEKARSRLLQLVDLDAKAYLAVVKARKATVQKRNLALKKAQIVPREICQICYAATAWMPFLVKEGNPHLLSDLECAAEMLWAGYRSAAINVRVNQTS